MKTLESNFINWIVTSSANPDKVALTVKGALIAVIPTLIVVAQLLHWNWSQDQLTGAVEGISAIVSGFLVIVGLARKMFYTFVQSPVPPSDPSAPSV